MDCAALRDELQAAGRDYRGRKAELVDRVTALRAAASPDGERGPKRPRGDFGFGASGDDEDEDTGGRPGGRGGGARGTRHGARQRHERSGVSAAT